MGTVDFDSEPAYWYEKTIRSSRRAGTTIRTRAAINRDEALIAGEVNRHTRRTVLGYVGAEVKPAQNKNCAHCGQPFSRAAWRERRLWRVIYPSHHDTEQLKLWRHLICP